ncbi:MAG: hypothetical protein WC637_22500 [Victivallales bacterium]
MMIRKRNGVFTVLNMLGCVGWLKEIEERAVIDNNENSPLVRVLPCQSTCGWTHCNPRCSLRHRERQLFSAVKLCGEKNHSALCLHDRVTWKAG